jgi:hypothetical protein
VLLARDRDRGYVAETARVGDGVVQGLPPGFRVDLGSDGVRGAG